MKIFVDTARITAEVKRHLPLEIDYITFSGKGEPTLAENIGEVIERLKKEVVYPLAILTNSSLLVQKAVRKRLIYADFVMAKKK